MVDFLAACVERGLAFEQEAAKITQVPAIVRNGIVGRARGFAQRRRECFYFRLHRLVSNPKAMLSSRRKAQKHTQKRTAGAHAASAVIGAVRPMRTHSFLEIAARNR